MPAALCTALPHAEGMTLLKPEKFLLLQYGTLKSSTTSPNKLKPHNSNYDTQTAQDCRFQATTVADS